MQKNEINAQQKYLKINIVTSANVNVSNLEEEVNINNALQDGRVESRSNL